MSNIQELSMQELYDLNDEITQRLNDEGWHADTDDDDTDLNDLVHRVAELRAKEEAMIQKFIAERVDH